MKSQSFEGEAHTKTSPYRRRVQGSEGSNSSFLSAEGSKRLHVDSADKAAKGLVGEENMKLPRVKLHEKENWNFDSYSTEDRSKVFEYIYRSYSGHISTVDVSKNDISRLRKGLCLNDALVNFYLRHLEQECIPEKLKERVFIFSSYFYQKLKQTNAETKDDRITNYMAVSRWTKGVDIFSRDFLIIPICEDSHWRLAIICYPKVIFDNAIEFFNSIATSPPHDMSHQSLSPKKTTSLVFLSSTDGDIRVPSQVIKSYLETEYFMRKMQEEHRAIFKQYDGYDRLFTVWKPRVNMLRLKDYIRCRSRTIW